MHGSGELHGSGPADWAGCRLRSLPVSSVTWADMLSTVYLVAASSSSCVPIIDPCSSNAEQMGVSFARSRSVARLFCRNK